MQFIYNSYSTATFQYFCRLTEMGYKRFECDQLNILGGVNILMYVSVHSVKSKWKVFSEMGSDPSSSNLYRFIPVKHRS